MNKILNSIAPVIAQAQHVRIDPENLEVFCKRFQGLQTSFKSPFTAVDLSSADKIQLDIAYNSANFCYWGEPKWTIEYQGNQISGAYGMKAAFNRALEEGFHLLDSSYLERIGESDFAHITRGSGELPLFRERLEFLHQLGRILGERYDGKARNLVDRAEGDALRLLDELTENFPCYSDTTEYNGKRVLFHKRAQLVVNNTHKTLESEGMGLINTDQLTALADYKVPQLLRNRGIFVYSPDLADKVDRLEVIEAGGAQETEIRAFTLEACEQMTTLLRSRFPSLKVIDLDRWLYLESKKASQGDKPHHRALTTAH
ncbi:hypothetical protein COU60_04800 [Candidatus Pacearchaeota archaeon CG10_big_fil_rev_8_21_14_0_10_34_76]|nr:MAG: hypothetical protein COU60_04800 [Candidatus Pacearchaeota archaeon CG10_big_fil_rev_8_21_14_0_10_34_76]